MILDYFINNWKYSNAPEGERPFEKVFGLTKYGLAGSFGVGIYDCLLLSQTQTFKECVNCMSYWMIPISAMCATFASVAYISAKVREKDDYFNYFVASLSAGGVFYQWQKSGVLSFYSTIILTACAMIKKHADLNGWVPLPMYPELRTQHTTLPFDWTLTKDPRGPRPWE